MKLRGKEGKTPIQKPLCRLCECPTSDGHVLGSQVDRIKLRKWAMKVMNLTEEDKNLPDVVGEDALICYFCIWQAEFGDESGDEAVAWWPKNLDLEENAKVLRENYSIGEVEQCWVQLEEIDLPEYDKEILEERKCDSAVCLYCGNSYNRLMEHVKLMHKEAIKCGIRGCMTYFYTEEEKELHMQEDLHKKRNKPRESKRIRCKYCENVHFFPSWEPWRQHMKYVHSKLSVRCSRVGCKEYFTSKSEMILHFNSHKRAINQDLFQCKHCEFFATKKFHMRKHIEGRHVPKIFKCDRCDAKFGSKFFVKLHLNKIHTFDKCKSCGQDVSLSYKVRHRKPKFCSKCKLRFKCSGLYQLHRKSCKQTLFSCEECGKSFIRSSTKNRHVRDVHTKKSTKIAKPANLFCNHCDYSTSTKQLMRAHLQRNHFPKTFKCDQCDKLYPSESFLKDHKQKWHKYVRCGECAQEVRRQNMLKHRPNKTCRRCKCKFKCLGLLEKHICLHSNNFYCDKCPKMYWQKGNLYEHTVRKHIKK